MDMILGDLTLASVGTEFGDLTTGLAGTEFGDLTPRMAMGSFFGGGLNAFIIGCTGNCGWAQVA